MPESETRRIFPEPFASPPPKASQAIRATDLARRVRHEIDTQLGAPLPPKWVVARLAEMRAALVHPYRLKVTDGRTPAERNPRRDVEIVADSGAALVAFDPHPEGDFAVIWRRPNGLALSNIRGDAVDCFLAI
jgi:hypothetical protein